MTVAFIAVGAGLVLLVWTVLAFNGLIRAHNQVDESWSGIDVQLKRRHDLVPNLVKIVAAYADHEQAVLHAVAQSCEDAELSSGRRGRQAAEQELSQSIVGVRTLSEEYPDLRSSEEYRRLQAQLAEVEGEIQYARRIYNANVQRYNGRIRGFPGSVVCKLGGYRPTGYFELRPVRLDVAEPRHPGTGREAAAA
jgi:LemA protein